MVMLFCCLLTGSMIKNYKKYLKFFYETGKYSKHDLGVLSCYPV